MNDSTPDFSSFRSGYVAIVGWPNVGKSTLLNSLLGFKLSIVSAKPQTTREAILGIINEAKSQLIFLDTPGWLSPDDNFRSYMRRAIMRSLYDDADIILWVLESKPLTPEQIYFAEGLAKTNKPLFVVFNKMDAGVSEEVMASVTAELKKCFPGEIRSFVLSAKTGQGVRPLRQALLTQLPFSPPYFPTDQLTDRWERFYVRELIREQIFEMFHQEIPHAAAVLLEEFVEKEGRKDHIRANIIVETDGQKNIILGKKGSSIKRLGQQSREEIEKRLGRPVYLDLYIKVKKNWRKDSAFLKQLMEEA